MAKSTYSAIRASRLQANRDGTGSELANLILRELPPSEFKQLHPSLELVRLKLHQVLHEAGETIRSIYFLNDGLSSRSNTQPGRPTIWNPRPNKT